MEFLSVTDNKLVGWTPTRGQLYTKHRNASTLASMTTRVNQMDIGDQATGAPPDRSWERGRTRPGRALCLV